MSEAGAATPLLVGGALVTAQSADPLAADAKDQVVVAAGTLSGADGGYALFLTPGDYNLVAVADGYLPACSTVSLLAATPTTADFALEPAVAAPGSISGSVSIAGAGADQVVTLDFRQEATCNGASSATTITVRSLNVANGGTFDVALPAGTFQVVAATAGHATQVFDNVVVATAAATDLGVLAF